MNKTSITRTTATDFDVTTPNGTRDTCMRLDVIGLRSFESRGNIRIGGIMRVSLGPKSEAIVRAMAIGQTVEL